MSLQTLTLSRGDGKALAITASENVSAATSLIFTAKRNKSDADTLAIFQHELGAGVEASGTAVTVTTAHADTSALNACVLYWDVQAQFATGPSPRTVAEGTLIITADITRNLDTSIPIYTTQPGATASAIASAAAAANSAATALAQAAIAATQAGLAATAKTAAEAAQAAAAASAAAALASEAASAASAAAALASQNAAAGSETAAAASASAAAASQAAAAASAAAALASQSAAATSATNAGTSETAAAASAGTAAGHATAAAGSAAAAAAVGASLIGPYLAAKAPRPGLISPGTSLPLSTVNSPAFGTSNNFTIGMWVRLPVFASTDIFLFGVHGTSTGFNGKIAAGSGRVQITARATGTIIAPPQAHSVATGNWVFLALAFNRAGNLTVYLDGVEVASASMSGIAGVSLTGGDLLWLAPNTGSGFATGTLGECWIVDGLLTSAQIAAINAASSIAPFASGIAFHQWLNCGQGYGAIIRDFSGNNRPALMGATVSHAFRRNPPGVPHRSPRVALMSDGASATFIRSQLNSQNPGTGEFSLWWSGVVPTDGTSSGTKTLAALTSSTSDILTARMARITYVTTNGIMFQIAGAAAGDLRMLSSPALLTALAGKRAVIVVTRASTGPRVFIGVDGDFFDATALFSDTGSGNPPAWTETIDGQYLFGFYRHNSTNNYTTQTLFDLRVANIAMTEAQLRADYERGEPGPEWRWGTNVNEYASRNDVFAYGAVDSSTVPVKSFGSMAWVAAAGARTGGAGSWVLRINGGGGDGFQYSNIAASIPVGAVYRTRLWARIVGNPGAFSVLLNCGGGFSANSAATNIRSLLTTEWIQVELLLTVTVPGTFTARLAFQSQSATFDASNYIEIDDIELIRIGYTARLRTDGAGFRAINDCAANGSTDFELSTSGVTFSPEPPAGTRAVIRGSFLASAISTLPGTTSAGILPPGWAVVDDQVDVSIPADSGRTLNLGTSGTPAKYVSGLPIDTAGLKQGAILSGVPNSKTGNTSLYWQKSSSTTAGELISTAIFIERKY